MTTPAQATGHPDFITDVPVQGPTDEGLRRADCMWKDRQLPAQPACVDCKGPIPMWATTSLASTRSQYSGIGERLSLRGHGALGFALEAAGDPSVWEKLTPDQQMWVSNSLNTLNNQIVAETGTRCNTWGPAINLAGGCFQIWYNANYATNQTVSKALRTDGVFDQDTLDALIMVAGIRKNGFTAYPKGGSVGPTAVLPVGAEKKLSTGAMVGIAAAGAVALGGIAYIATHKKRKS